MNKEQLMAENQQLREYISELEQTKSAHARLIDILDSTSDLVATATPDSKLQYLNNAGRELLGWPDDELSDRCISHAHPPGGLDVVMKDGLPSANRDGIWRGENILINSKGEEIPVSQVIMAHKSPDGEVEYHSTIMRDISERKRVEQLVTERTADLLRANEELQQQIQERQRSEEAYKATEARYSTLYKSAGDAIFLMKGDSFVDCNPKTLEMFGCTPEQIIGKPPWIFSPPTQPDGMSSEKKARGKLRKVFEGEQLFFEWKHFPYDKSLFDAEVTLTRLEIGGEYFVLALVRDITDRKRAEEALRQSEERLRHSQKMEAVGQLAGGVAHDFNNLLLAILGYSELSMKNLPDEEDKLRSNLEEIHRAGERAAALTRQLLAFSRRQVLQPEDLDLNLVIAEVMKMLRRLIGEHIELEIVPGHGLDLVNADSSQIEQVLMNLAVNARDAMTEGGTITIKTENIFVDSRSKERKQGIPEGNYVLMSVRDTGCGIAPTVLERIFEPFFTTKEVGRGTGLGLATVYGIVQQHNGFINVESEQGEGSVFNMYLPTVDPNAARAAGETGGAPPGGNETILLAEDEPTVRSLAVQILEKAGYRVLTAANGVEALKIFESHADEIDLAFLDVVMPKMTGRTVQNRIRSKKPDLPFLFTSGYSEEVIQGQLDPADTARLIQKPYNPDKLLRRIREVLDG
ncbi:MAG: PAS domain S-box protein [Planctomycetota bacterium]